MAAGSWSSGASSAVIVAADGHRDYLVIQNGSTNTVALGLGTAAVAGKGIQLKRDGDIVKLRGHHARGVVYAIGTSGAGTYQTGDVDFIPGPHVA